MSVDDLYKAPASGQYHPLSASQQRLWMFHQLKPNSVAYNNGGLLWFDDDRLDINRLFDALQHMLNEHPALTMIFDDSTGTPLQKHDESNYQIEVKDISSYDDPIAWLEKETKQVYIQPYQLVNAKLLRLHLYKISEGRFAALLAAHHLIIDAWTLQLCCKSILSYLTNKPNNTLKGTDYLTFAANTASDEEIERSRSEWQSLGLMSDEPLQIPSLTRSTDVSYTAGHVESSLNQKEKVALSHAAKSLGITRFELLSSALLLTLSQYGNHSHPSVVVPTLNRNSKNRRTAGFFVSNSLLGLPLTATTTLQEITQTVKTKLSQSVAFSHLSAEQLCGQQSLPSYAFNYRTHGEGLELTANHYRLVFEEFPVVETPFELVLDAISSTDLTLRFVYAKEKFSADFIERFIASYKKTLQAICFAPSSKKANLNLLSEQESTWLDQVSGPNEEWKNTLFCDLLSQQAQLQPDHIALQHGKQTLTYRQLDRQTNQLAHYFINNGVQPDCVVGVMMERGISMFVAMIGILKAGGAFLPLDPDYPEQRLRFMLEDSGALFLMTQSSLLEKGNSLTQRSVIALESLDLEHFPDVAPTLNLQPLNLAYLIYTSGSTGTPKGVAVDHRGLSMHVQTIGQRYGMTPDDTELHFASISFDGALERWTVPLAFGSRLIIRDQALWTPEQTTQVLCEEQVTIACFPPSYVGPLLDWIEKGDWQKETQRPLALRSITLGGEAFTKETFERIQRVIAPPRIINGYGPTETVVTPLIWSAYPNDSLKSAYAPIGTAVGARKLYVLNEELQRLPVGSIGELYIGMEEGLARGYFKRPDLTAERFLPDPFANNGERMYRTGDLVRFTHDGIVEYFGRADQQVKIRGFRIELGEIESRLQTLSKARFCAVMAHESPTGKKLVGYVQTDASQQEAAYWLEDLAQQLPDYMVPSQIVVADSLPITPAGKIDRKSLKAPQWQNNNDAQQPLKNAKQELLASLWRDLLKLPTVGANSHFFSSGGDSIAALQLVGKLRQHNLMLTPKQVFDHPILADMAECLVDNQTKTAQQTALIGAVSLLPMQTRFVDHYSLSLCNQFARFQLPTPIDQSALKSALTSLIQHHDALRLAFDDNQQATYLNGADVAFQLYDNSLDSNAVQQAIDPKIGRQLSLGVQVDSGEALLAIHHLVIDALSWPILLDDLINLYQGLIKNRPYTLSPKTHHQGDWHQALKSYSMSDQERMFWSEQQAPIAFPHSRGTARRAQWHLNQQTAQALFSSTQHFAKLDKEASLLSLVACAIAAQQQQTTLLIHKESHGRFAEAFQLDLARSVNWHTALFPQKILISDQLNDTLAHIKDVGLAVPSGGIGYSAGVLQGAWHYADSIDVLFNYLGSATKTKITDIQLSEFGLWRPDDSPSDAAIVINIAETDQGLEFAIELDNQLFSEQEANNLIQYLEQFVATIIQYCQQHTPILTTHDAKGTELNQTTLTTISQSLSTEDDSRLPEKILPLSTLQQGLYFHAQLSNQQHTYVNQITLPIRGAEPSKLLVCWQTLMERHAMLRSTISQIDGQAHLFVWPELTLKSSYQDERRNQAFNLPHAKRHLIEQGFHLEQPLTTDVPEPLWRVDLIQTTEQEIECIFTIHHVLMDGWSTGILLNELFALYQGHSLPRVQQDFSDYLAWVSQQKDTQSEQYWRESLNKVDAPTLLADLYGQAQSSQGYIRSNVDIDVTTLATWQSKLKHSGLTLNTLIQSAWLLTLQRYTGQDNPVFGNTVAGRPTALANSDAMVGLFINTLPVTSDIQWQRNVKDWLNQLQDQASSQREFSHTSLSMVQNLSPLKGENLFDTLVVFENYPLDDALFNQDSHQDKLTIGEPDSYEFTHYPLTLAVLPSEQLRIVFAYDSAYFDDEQIQALQATTRHYLEQLVTHLEQPLSTINLLDKTQENTLQQHNKASEPWDYSPFTELFKTQVKQRLNHQALVANPLENNGKQAVVLTYQELDQQSDALAAELLSQGIQREQIVGALFQRGNDMLVTMIGILKAGAAFLPLDPSYPEDRLRYMLEDSDASCVISDQLSFELAKKIDTKGRIIGFDSINLHQTLSEQPTLLPDQLAYVIYTSGSTGKPKGVCISQLGLSMHVQTIGQRYGMKPEDRELHFASISFDGAIERWTTPLAFGSTLIIRDQRLWSAQETCDVLEREKITIACFPPSYVGPLLEWVESTTEKPDLVVRSWTLGGEAFTRDTYYKLQNTLHPQRIINGYGPTETVVTPLIWQAYADTPLNSAYAPIGTAVGARDLYVLDKHLLPVPSGVSGELYIGDETGLARGYLARPDLTAERFIPNPFSQYGERMYRTGDLVRWRDDGVMEYLGRTDDQVKIRGFRIELGEIESRLQQLSGSRRSAVVAFDGLTGKTLIGYIESTTTTFSEHTIDCSDILQKMRQALPDYMVPAQLIVLDSLPLTPASKVDKKRLPEPNLQITQTEFVAPQGDLEIQLASEWQHLFKLDRVSRQDDFFALGGQSLLATQLVGRLQQRHQIHLPLQAVFDAPTLCDMASRCQANKNDSTPIKTMPRLTYMPVSTAQKRLWFVQELMPESSAYHMPLGIKLSGQIDHSRLENALQALINKHEIFRTTFAQVEGELMQTIHQDVAIHIPCHRASDFASLEQQREHWISDPFDFAQAPLLRTYLVEHNSNEHELLLVIHHIVSDGLSMQALIQEWFTLYQDQIKGIESDADSQTRLDYADYAYWQQDWLQSSQAKQDLLWWKQALKADIEPLILHSEVPRDPQQVHGRRHHFELSKQQVTQIQALASAHKTTAFNVMLSLWHVLMHKYTSQNEIRVGVPVAGRHQTETQKMQGCFINSVTVPATVSATETFSDLLNQVKTFVKQALSRQDVPFESIVEALGVTGNLQHHPLYQTSFNFQQIALNALPTIEDVDIELFDPGVVGAQLELSLDIQQFTDSSASTEKWAGFVNYAAPVFDEAFVQSLIEYWLLLLDTVSDNHQHTIAALTLVNSESSQSIAASNATNKDWGGLLPPPVSIMQQAALTPDAPALSMGTQTMSYQEFDHKVTQLANWLRKQGVKEETRVGLGLPRSIDLVIGLHAITRVGGAYVPLDPSYPKDRLAYILNSADVSILLTDEQTLTLWPDNPNCRYIAIDTLDTSNESLIPPPVNWQQDLALYVIFTSGSTGLPKGVVNTQAALQNRLQWMQSEYQLNASDCVLQKTPFSFDVSVWEFFWPLMFGARLAIAPPEHHRQPELIHNTIVEQKVTTIHFVPSMLHAFASDTNMADCTSLKRIICSGEALPAELADNVLTTMTSCELHNLYGPTEAAIDVSYWQCQQPVGRRTPIGHPISNIQLHVLDEYWNPLPVGIPGELYLAGDGLAREYLARADLTAERFVPNPLGQPGSRMYRTGDKVLRMPDGRLEYLDRLDHQVKIRGLRIELEEIENVLNQQALVEESAVIAYDYKIGTTNEKTSTQLVAYIVSSQWTNDSEAQVKAHLAEHLPDYMIPAIFIALDAMPLSPSGKRDRKALPSPEWNQVHYRAPESELEQWFANTWQRVLGVDKVGLDDNFFALGGHSLLATKIVSLAQKELAVELTLKDFFAASSLQALTDNLESHYQNQHESEQEELDAMAALMDDLEML
ncbi:MAG: amino acid adenylation domain-containing protein [Marinomonas sp.]